MHLFKPHRDDFYQQIREKYPDADLHPECGKWVKNSMPDCPEQLERNGHYCVAFHHHDCVELLVNGYVGPPFHYDPEELKKYQDQGIVGLYYNPHPIAEILKTANKG